MRQREGGVGHLILCSKKTEMLSSNVSRLQRAQIKTLRGASVLLGAGSDRLRFGMFPPPHTLLSLRSDGHVIMCCVRASRSVKAPAS